MIAEAAHDTDKPGVEEIYERATSTSNLKHDAIVRTSADVLRDMAISSDKLGLALARLRGQWESALKPTRPKVRSVKEFLAILPLVNGKPDTEGAKEHNEAEQREMDAAFASELNALAARLMSYPQARDALILQAIKWKIPDATDTAAATLRYWLDQTCPRCNGLKFQLLPGAPSLSNKMCPSPHNGGCGGTGYVPAPCGQDGRKLANYLDQCMRKYKQRNSSRRKQLAALPPIERLSKRVQDDNED